MFVPVRNPVHFFPVHLRISSPKFFVLLLDSLVQTPMFDRTDRRNRSMAHPYDFRLFAHARSLTPRLRDPGEASKCDGCSS